MPLTQHRVNGIFFSAMKKIGPNDPCPCNSGKKLKKCCIVAAQNPNINTPAKQIARRVAMRWANTVGHCKELLEDLNLGQQRIAEFDEVRKSEPKSLTDIPLIGEPWNRWAY